MGECLITRKGGGKSEGLYVWKKYEVKEKILSYPTIDLKAINTYLEYELSSSYFDIALIEDESFFNGWIIAGHTDYVFTYKNNKLTLSNGTNTFEATYTKSTKRINFSSSISAIGSIAAFIYTGNLSIKINEFLDYVVSDNETKYPDGDVQDGYYYERVVSSEEKIVTGEVTFASPVNLKIEHGLGTIPKIMVVLPYKDATQGQSYNYSDTFYVITPSPWTNKKIGSFYANAYVNREYGTDYIELTDTQFRQKTTYVQGTFKWIAIV